MTSEYNAGRDYLSSAKYAMLNIIDPVLNVADAYFAH